MFTAFKKAQMCFEQAQRFILAKKYLGVRCTLNFPSVERYGNLSLD